MLTVSTEIDRSDQYQRPRVDRRQSNRSEEPAGVADAERAIDEIGHRGAKRRGGDDGRPVEKGMKRLRDDLQGYQQHQRNQVQGGPRQITPVQGHRDGIATSHAKRGCRDFDDPEGKCNLGNLVM